MNKQLKIIICFVMASALALIIFCSLNYSNLGTELRSLQRQLDESREKWEGIAAEKEALQEDLKAKQKELNIAKLELDSSTAEAGTIRADIEQLKQDIEALKQVSK